MEKSSLKRVKKRIHELFWNLSEVESIVRSWFSEEDYTKFMVMMETISLIQEIIEEEEEE